MNNIRFRHLYMAFFSILIIIASFLADPDSGLIQELPFGAGTVAMLLVTVRAVIYITLLHVSRRALFDYIDLEVYFNEARAGNMASGLAIIGIAIAMLAISLLIAFAVA